MSDQRLDSGFRREKHPFDSRQNMDRIGKLYDKGRQGRGPTDGKGDQGGTPQLQGSNEEQSFWKGSRRGIKASEAI